MKLRGLGIAAHVHKSMVIVLPAVALHDIRCPLPGCRCGKTIVRISIGWLVWTGFLDVFLRFGRHHEN